MLYIDTQAKLHRAAMVVSAGRLHRAATVVSARRLHRAATVVKGLNEVVARAVTHQRLKGVCSAHTRGVACSMS